jgi:TPR repeat protein
MGCIFCGPFKWLCARINAGCAETHAEFRKRANSWDFKQADDTALFERDPERDRIKEAFLVMEADPEAGFLRLLELAEHGSVWSMNHVASSYYRGSGVARDPAEAEDWFRRAFEGGSEYAQLRYGKILGQRGDFDRCEEVFGVGVAEEWAPALYWSARYRLHRSKTRETLRQIRPLLERASAKGSVPAYLMLASATLWGGFGLREIPCGVRLVWKGVSKVEALMKDGTTHAPSTPITLVPAPRASFSRRFLEWYAPPVKRVTPAFGAEIDGSSLPRLTTQRGSNA